MFDNQRITIHSEGDVKYGVTFYAGCAPTHRAVRGLLVERGGTPEDGLLWIHGPQTGNPGGGAWKQQANCNAVPTDYCGTDARWTKATIKMLADAGWDAQNGFAKLDAFCKM